MCPKVVFMSYILIGGFSFLESASAEVLHVKNLRADVHVQTGDRQMAETSDGVVS